MVDGRRTFGADLPACGCLGCEMSVMIEGIDRSSQMVLDRRNERVLRGHESSLRRTDILSQTGRCGICNFAVICSLCGCDFAVNGRHDEGGIFLLPKLVSVLRAW